MPRKRFNTPRKVIYYEYAKLIYRSRYDKWGVKFKSGKDYIRIEYIFKQLLDNKIKPSNILRENKLLVGSENSCVYCGASENLQWEHIIPKAKGGPDIIDNMVLACRKCNLSKGARDIFDWCQSHFEIPRIVLGKHLKLLLLEYEKQKKMDSTSDELGFELSRKNLALIFETNER